MTLALIRRSNHVIARSGRTKQSLFLVGLIRIRFFTVNSIPGTGWGHSFAADDAEPSHHCAQESPQPGNLIHLVANAYEIPSGFALAMTVFESFRVIKIDTTFENPYMQKVPPNLTF
ncbi:MAG TPA: hypothetical protein VK463_17675 [Desulfomonilaceae bacterium]|nr:hypothetical protein [Desulfomonilaceae bacterium]